jgi:pimeloyl-ACP methyl ester carboxylesterase
MLSVRESRPLVMRRWPVPTSSCVLLLATYRRAEALTTQRMLTRPAAQPALIADLRESYRQGTTVMAADLLRYSRPWGFRLDEVTTTVHLWHGEQDPKVPITVARQLATSLPGCHAHFGAGGHLMACDHAGEILTTLTSALERGGKKADPRLGPVDRQGRVRPVVLGRVLLWSG